MGQYRRIDGIELRGSSLSSLVAAREPGLNNDLRRTLTDTENALRLIIDKAEGTGRFAGQPPMKFDQMIAAGNTEGKKMITAAINELALQAQLIDQIAISLDIDAFRPDITRLED